MSCCRLLLLLAVLLAASYSCANATSPTRRLLLQHSGDTAASALAKHLHQVVSEAANASVVAAPIASAPLVCASTYQQANLRPLREQWTGYGGELAVQAAALTRGVWVGQRQARIIGTGSEATPLLLQPRSDASGMLPLMRDKLLFSLPSTSYWDSLNQTVTGGNTTIPTGVVSPPAASYLAWVKAQVAAGRPVITGLRLNSSAAGGPPSFYYDQVATVFGVCTTNGSTNVVNATDSFTITAGNGAETNRSASYPTLYAKWQECPYGSGEVGCVPSDIFSYGLSVGDLTDLGRISLRTTKLTISGWSDGTPATREPGEAGATAATAKYSLQVWGLTVGKTYRTYRIQGLLGGTTLPTSKAALEVIYQSRLAASRKLSFVASATSMALTEAQLGAFPANSVQTFITALWV